MFLCTFSECYVSSLVTLQTAYLCRQHFRHIMFFYSTIIPFVPSSHCDLGPRFSQNLPALSLQTWNIIGRGKLQAVLRVVREVVAQMQREQALAVLHERREAEAVGGHQHGHHVVQVHGPTRFVLLLLS